MSRLGSSPKTPASADCLGQAPPSTNARGAVAPVQSRSARRWLSDRSKCIEHAGRAALQCVKQAMHVIVHGAFDGVDALGRSDPGTVQGYPVPMGLDCYPISWK